MTGVFPVVTTKLTEEGRVDLQATAHSVNTVVDAGVSGVIMLRENASMSLKEREKIIGAAVPKSASLAN